MSVTSQAQGLGAAVADTFKAIVGSPKGFVNSFKGVSSGTVAKEGFSLGGIIAAPFKASANVAVWTIKQPIAWGLGAAKWCVKGVGTAYRKAPVLMVPLTVIGGIAAVNSHLRHRAEKREQAAQEQKLMEIAQIQAQTPQAPLAQANTTYVPAPAADVSLPAQGTAMNEANPQLMAGNDNRQSQGTLVGQQRAASL